MLNKDRLYSELPIGIVEEWQAELTSNMKKYLYEVSGFYNNVQHLQFTPTPEE